MSDVPEWMWLVLAAILGPVIGSVVTARFSSVERAVSRYWRRAVGIPTLLRTKVRTWKENRRLKGQVKCRDRRGHEDLLDIVTDEFGRVFRILQCMKCGYRRVCSHKDKDGVRTENEQKQNLVVDESACTQCGFVFWGTRIRCVLCDGQYGGGMQSLNLGLLDRELEPLRDYMPLGLVQRCGDVEGCYRRVLAGFDGTMDTQAFREAIARRQNNWIRERRNSAGDVFLGDELPPFLSRDKMVVAMTEIYEKMEAGECEWYRPRRPSIFG